MPRRVQALCGLAAIVLAVSVAGCGGNDDGAGRGVLDTQTTVRAASPTDVMPTATPASTPAATAATAASGASSSVDDELTTLDAKLADAQTALDEFDQMTATTEGDPSR